MFDRVAIDARLFVRWGCASGLAPYLSGVNRPHRAGFPKRRPALVGLQRFGDARFKHVVLRSQSEHEGGRGALSLVRAAMRSWLRPSQDVGLTLVIVVVRRSLSGRGRVGDTLEAVFPMKDETVRVKVTEPCFHDPEGNLLNV